MSLFVASISSRLDEVDGVMEDPYWSADYSDVIWS